MGAILPVDGAIKWEIGVRTSAEQTQLATAAGALSPMRWEE